MNRIDGLETLRRLRAALEARGVAHAALLGSVAGSQAAGSSDIDILIEPASGKRLDLIDLGGVQTMLEDAFGSEVDVVVAPVKNTKLSLAIARDRVDAF